MRATVHPGGFMGGQVRVPGDKSIAHRWLILAATGRGSSELRGLPVALDVRSTARCLGALLPREARDGLERWASDPAPQADRDRSTYNQSRPRGRDCVLEGQGRVALHPPSGPLDCGNSGTTMRLMAGVLAASPFEAVLEGDESLSARPMERVAGPLRAMGARVRTSDGGAPMVVHGGPLRGIEHRSIVPSAQVKSAVLLAGLSAEGETTVLEEVPTRDHTERALEHLGAPIDVGSGRSTVRSFQQGGFDAEVPGDVSSAAFLVAAALLGGVPIAVRDVGLNPTRTRFLDVLERMGAVLSAEVERVGLGEPQGRLEVEPCSGLTGTTVEAGEVPLVIDEIPVLALVAAHAEGETRFASAGELRAKESDRLGGLVEAIRALGGAAAVEGDDLVVGGGGLRGGHAAALGDHRLAMAIAVSALAAREAITIVGVEAADVSYPGFLGDLVALGARVEA